MKIIDADAFEKYAWGNPDIEVDGEPYISPSTVQNFAADHPITIDPPNEPLTLEQLREMDGEPVWVEEVEHWALIDTRKSGQWAGILFAVWAENGVNFTYNIEDRNLHCYRRPPEGETDE